MRLYTYLRCRHFTETNTVLAVQAQRMAEDILKENIDCPGKWPTVDSMWRELLRRAKEIDESIRSKQLA